MQVQDLLSETVSSLPIRFTQDRGFFVDDLVEVNCKNVDDALSALDEGLRNRITRSHNLNEYSSRSHSILTISIETPMPDGNGKVCGKMRFVDLAGSERIKQSDTKGESLAETLKINKSLLTLGNVISHLSRNPLPQHIPYRDSKLTMLLSDSLGGNGVTIMVACISSSPSNFAETIKTLRYACRAMRVVNVPTVSVRKGVHEEVRALRGEVGRLRKENERLKGLMGSSTAEGSSLGIGRNEYPFPVMEYGHVGAVPMRDSGVGFAGSGIGWIPGVPPWQSQGHGSAYDSQSRIFPPPFPPQTQQPHPSQPHPYQPHYPPFEQPLYGRRSASQTSSHQPQSHPSTINHFPSHPPSRAPSYAATPISHSPYNASTSATPTRSSLTLNSPRDVARSRSLLWKDLESLDKEIQGMR
ncbi:Kinesin- protein 12 [Rhizophlyctis rosea]|uniref:Kinesin-like protein n=1 Tax=Rhizophlyctis rosea TaxID=64517 RepID=A0AAD5X305_9FUNG|nr:Kinesin- protein 12 [Rhizophlyctis rosea]